jgi:3-polyprenyl-4-hydroxybenzoate decarboxylase
MSVAHPRDNRGATSASGSFRHDMKTLSATRFGYADGLIPRSAGASILQQSLDGWWFYRSHQLI